MEREKLRAEAGEVAMEDEEAMEEVRREGVREGVREGEKFGGRSCCCLSFPVPLKLETMSFIYAPSLPPTPCR